MKEEDMKGTRSSTKQLHVPSKPMARTCRMMATAKRTKTQRKEKTSSLIALKKEEERQKRTRCFDSCAAQATTSCAAMVDNEIVLTNQRTDIRRNAMSKIIARVLVMYISTGNIHGNRRCKTQGHQKTTLGRTTAVCSKPSLPEKPNTHAPKVAPQSDQALLANVVSAREPDDQKLMKSKTTREHTSERELDILAFQHMKRDNLKTIRSDKNSESLLLKTSGPSEHSEMWRKNYHKITLYDTRWPQAANTTKIMATGISIEESKGGDTS